MNYQTTYEWLKSNFSFTYEINNYEIMIRDNRVMSFVAGMKKYSHILAIYKSENEYCVHSFDESDGWLETDTPMFGYFYIELTWDELLQQIANKYDLIRNSMIK